MGLFERDTIKLNRWFFRVMVDPIEGNIIAKSYENIKKLLGTYNQNFIEETVNKYILSLPLPYEIMFQKNIWIPINSQFTFIGLGWDIQRGMVYDLDVSLIVFDINNKIMELFIIK